MNETEKPRYVTHQEFMDFKLGDFAELQRDVRHLQYDMDDVRTEVRGLSTKFGQFSEDMAVMKFQMKLITTIIAVPALLWTTKQLIAFLDFG